MSRKKKTPVRAHKVKSSGVWIAPNLERTIKGERGRRGLSEPPYSYYLLLADIALKSSAPSTAAPPDTVWPVLKSPKRPKLNLPKPPKTRKPPRLIVPKPPKSNRPKPPKR